MKEPMGLAARVEMLRELLAKEGSLKTSEIRIYFASLGVSDKCIMHTTHHAYKYGITHRRKNYGTNGYEYRLASKYPRWGNAIRSRRAGSSSQCCHHMQAQEPGVSARPVTESCERWTCAARNRSLSEWKITPSTTSNHPARNANQSPQHHR